MVAKQTEKTINKTVDKNTEDKNTVNIELEVTGNIMLFFRRLKGTCGSLGREEMM